MHNGSAYQGLTSAGGVYNWISICTGQLLSAASNSIQPLMFSWRDLQILCGFFCCFFLFSCSFVQTCWECINTSEGGGVCFSRTEVKKLPRSVCVWIHRLICSGGARMVFFRRASQVPSEKIKSCDECSATVTLNHSRINKQRKRNQFLSAFKRCFQ